MFLLTLLFSIQTFATAPSPSANPEDQEFVDKLIVDIQAGVNEVYPSKWTSEIQSKEIQIDKFKGREYSGGRAYGAICWKQLNFTFPQIVGLFTKGGIPEKLVRKVKTLVNIQDLAEVSPGRIFLQTEIDVPVISNFRTQVQVMESKIGDRKYTVEWKQLNDFGDLNYNHGIANLEPDGDRTKMTVIGIHIIKEEKKVPWIGRATAAKFAKDHYCNFIRAAETLEN